MLQGAHLTKAVLPAGSVALLGPERIPPRDHGEGRKPRDRTKQGFEGREFIDRRVVVVEKHGVGAMDRDVVPNPVLDQGQGVVLGGGALESRNMIRRFARARHSDERTGTVTARPFMSIRSESGTTPAGTGN